MVLLLRTCARHLIVQHWNHNIIYIQSQKPLGGAASAKTVLTTPPPSSPLIPSSKRHPVCYKSSDSSLHPCVFASCGFLCWNAGISSPHPQLKQIKKTKTLKGGRESGRGANSSWLTLPPLPSAHPSDRHPSKRQTSLSDVTQDWNHQIWINLKSDGLFEEEEPSPSLSQGALWVETGAVAG